MKSLRTHAAELRTATGFLTVLPVYWRREAGTHPSLGQSAGWFPWVGAAIGLGAGATWWLSSLALPPLLAAVLAVTTWVILTGGLHLDGLADCCDGLLSAAPREKRLEIMRDPRLGSFGVIGLCLALLIKVAAIYSLPASNAIPAMLLAASSARGLLLLAGGQPTARAGGMGEEFSSGLRRATLPLAAVPVIGLSLWLGWSSLLALLAALLSTLGIFALARRRIGGLTGDVLGLVVEAGEMAVLLAVCLRFPL